MNVGPSSENPANQSMRAYQELIELIQEPCFIFFRDPGAALVVNSQLVKLLDYSSLEDFYRNELLLDKLISNKELIKVAKASEEASKFKTNKFIACKCKRKNGTFINSILYLRPMLEPNKDNVYAYLGTIHQNEKKGVYNIDKSLIHMFNEGGFADEVIVINDFKGNILASNKKFYMIDFYVDFSKKRLNLFNSIDKQYHNTLSRRILQLRKGITTPVTEYKLVSRDGKSAYIEVYSKIMMYKNRKVIVSLVRDISIRKETEKELLYSVVQTEEKERQRFAQDLHDELGPFLSGLKLYMHEFQANSEDYEKRKILIKYLTEMIDEAVDKVRMIASNLTPQNMIDIGLTGSVNKMIDKLNNTRRINIVLEAEGQEAGIEHSFIITLYRIILELINNSIKHAKSSNISIKLIFKKKTVGLIYTDDGKGFDLKKELSLNKGIGLKSILNRIELYRGTYKFKRTLPKGIEFNMSFPI
jgi:PAS domain S-box-containing protein